MAGTETNRKGDLRFIQRVSEPSGASKKFGEVDLPTDVSVRFTLETYLKSYATLDKKFAKASSPHDKFDISVQILKKAFNIKEYDCPPDKPDALD